MSGGRGEGVKGKEWEEEEKEEKKEKKKIWAAKQKGYPFYCVLVDI